jgi:amino acid adenylation domain-containing protein
MEKLTVQGFRLSPQQKQIWALQEAFPATAFRALYAVAVEGVLRDDILRQALSDVVRQHEILRTTFSRTPGIKTPFQIIVENSVYSYEDADLSGLDEYQQQEKIETLFLEERRRPLNFEEESTLRAICLKLSADQSTLIISLPAVCADSLTLTNLLVELSRAYQSNLQRQRFSTETMQYADFAEWQNTLLESNDEHALKIKALWNTKLGESLKVPELPHEKHFVEQRTFETQSIFFQIDRALCSSIKEIASEHQTSVSAILFTCWQTLVWRLSGLRNFAIHTLYEGRKFDDLDAALGPYAKYLPILCDLENDRFDEQLRHVTEALSEIDEWQEYFDPASSLLRTPGGIAFDFEELQTMYRAGDLTLTVLNRTVFVSPFKLKLRCVLSGEELSAELQYDEQIFDRGTMERMSGYFLQLVNAVAASVRAPAAIRLGAIDLVSEDEGRRLLIDVNRTSTRFPDDECIHQMFEAQVERTPEAPAVVFADAKLSYRELNAQANQVAHLLRGLGVRSNMCVGLCMQRSEAMIVGLLGILKAGGAYVPLNPEHPSGRLKSQLVESGAKICLTNDPMLAESLDLIEQAIDFKRDCETLASQPETNPGLEVTPDALVYVIYTSGSTGTPKGVAVCHKNLVNYTRFILGRLQVEGPMHFATVSTISADLGNTCIFPSLVSGGCLHLLSYDVTMQGDLFGEYVAGNPIDVLKIVPSHLQALLASGLEQNILPSKFLILGGEALSWELVHDVSENNPGCKIINHYGPTETTIGSLTFDVGNQSLAISRTVPIGRPVANTRVYVVDQHMRLVPTGVAGELYIGGSNVALGYVNRPAETASRFIPDPFSSEPGSRLYRTGDLVRSVYTGDLEFLGRVDRQVKVRGYRVELGEIEAALREHSRISQAVVVVRNHDAAEKIVAYIVAQGPTPPSEDEIREHLRQRLPDYMIPSGVIHLRSLPLTPNGKVDQAALLVQEDSKVKVRTFVAPRTSVENELAQIWASLLKMDEVGVNDNFFDLGGHSLLATQVISRIRKTLQADIALRRIFESPTIAELAGEIENARHSISANLRTQLEAMESLTDEEALRLVEQEKRGGT